MSLFVIADLHLSLSTNKPMDVFHGWSDYVERLKTNWDAIVKPEDVVVIAGDISWAMKLEDTYEDFKFINERPGKKLFMKGNHDYWWTTKNKMVNYLKENGFDTIEIVHNSAYIHEDIGVCGTRGWMYNSVSEEDKKIILREVGRLKTSLEVAVKAGVRPVAFLHYPPVYGDFVSEEMMDTLKKYGVKDCYYGHIHNSAAAKKAVIGEYDGIKMHLISCDTIGFCPVLVR
ncbi:MAG: serine/threonine protein phosphatase [Ruminococcaceae bacterium]|nr:serine/threonine protein phosphatase [Oscillospiraceae bacterium]